MATMQFIGVIHILHEPPDAERRVRLYGREGAARLPAYSILSKAATGRETC